ncbi:hypothetical protein JOF48_001647 [Arthrobacter stackebrandtii]|uniref:VTC domain-containing protein n=1 Tax=Arthrobacter stackebrandtii TaxID=272161 RepID=A0ABS4YVN3_9MICC|nr:polyphosphate polymerase domain-containing protein [Arthrobacter stackebrandtii]MBP2412848.1 hypothetical protein [Arthrobacter stackebrandtii]PYH01334.1 molecular chaperone [Arthrobacter stackebrandtii]
MSHATVPANAATTLPASLAQLPVVSLAELNELASLQTRIDRKYVVPAHRLPGLLAGVNEEMRVLETDDIRAFAYDSVYFDTPELASYHLAAHGRRRRFKIRTRSYQDAGICFLEVKTEGSRSATVKEHIPYLPADRSTITADGAAYIRETLADTAPALSPEALAPVLETRYNRITLLLPESNSRATIDLAVTWTIPEGPQLVLSGKVVVETKSGSAPSGLDKHLWRAGIRPSRISKFATGMALLIPDLPANRWHRTLRQHMPHPTSPTRSTP